MSASFYPRPSFSQTVSVFDQNQLAQLRQGVRHDGGGEAEQRKVAEQFEALFIQQLLKQARAAASGNGMFNSEQVKTAQAMGDEQLALQLANPGMGLADALMAQMRQKQGTSGLDALPARTMPELSASRDPQLRSRVGASLRINDAPSIGALIKKLVGPAQVDKVVAAVRGAPEHVRNFVEKMQDVAERVASQTGVPVKLLMSQAALESGWGKREILHENGQTTHNLFGIKATGGWKGKVANIMTTEYQNGEYKKMQQPFRAYDSYEDSLADYARLISQNPRYEAVLTASTPQEAAHRVQAAGYATDPKYAQKLISIMAYFDSGAL